MTNAIKDSCSNAVKSYAAVAKPDVVASYKFAAETVNDLQKAIKSARGEQIAEEMNQKRRSRNLIMMMTSTSKFQSNGCQELVPKLMEKQDLCFLVCQMKTKKRSSVTWHHWRVSKNTRESVSWKISLQTKETLSRNYHQKQRNWTQRKHLHHGEWEDPQKNSFSRRSN